jgi:hypothetical protein
LFHTIRSWTARRALHPPTRSDTESYRQLTATAAEAVTTPGRRRLSASNGKPAFVAAVAISSPRSPISNGVRRHRYDTTSCRHGKDAETDKKQASVTIRTSFVGVTYFSAPPDDNFGARAAKGRSARRPPLPPALGEHVTRTDRRGHRRVRDLVTCSVLGPRPGAARLTCRITLASGLTIG